MQVRRDSCGQAARSALRLPSPAAVTVSRVTCAVAPPLATTAPVKLPFSGSTAVIVWSAPSSVTPSGTTIVSIDTGAPFERATTPRTCCDIPTSVSSGPQAEPGAEAHEIHYEETNWKARPDFSPDGKRMVYASYLGRSWHQLWVMPSEGGDVFPISYGDYDNTNPRYSYFVGCSAGGKQAMKEAQMFPADYDGVVVGDCYPDFLPHEHSDILDAFQCWFTL